MPRSARTRTKGAVRIQRWRLLAILMAVLAVAAATAGWAHQSIGPDSPGHRATVRTDPTQPTQASPADLRPRWLRIPGIDVDTALVPLGLNADRTVEVPSDPDEAGWYHLGPLPGATGSAVILGHVDSTSGPAVFYRLRTLAKGDRIEVTRADGSVARFAVRSLVTYPNADFPARKIYRNTGPPTLTLVTCGGAYDRSRGGYQANVVVYADLVATTGVSASAYSQ